MKTKTKYTEEEAYELASKWVSKLNRNLSTENDVLNFAYKIWIGEITVGDLEAIIAPPEQ
jgi:hypothetical protein